MRFWKQKPVERSGYPLSLQEYGQYFTYLNSQYPLFGYNTAPTNEKIEEITSSFTGFAGGAYSGNGVVFACVLSRLQLFAEARFQYRRFDNGRPGALFGDPGLSVLERPEPGKTTGDLLAKMEVDVSLAGNAFLYRSGNRIRRLRPDWMAIVLGGDEPYGPDLEVAGYVYFPGGKAQQNPPVAFMRDEIAHYAPIPDPLASHRGMSWITPVVREVMADSGWRDHKIKFLEQGGVPPVFYKVDPQSMTADAFNRFVERFRVEHEGAANAYKALFMRAAVDPVPLGINFEQMDFKKVQGAGETRIAAAAGVPPIVVGLSEGLESATYSNYGQARRRFADQTMRPLWRNAAASLETIVPPPNGAELWYDDRDISALQEDQKDAADILQAKAAAIQTLINSGWEPDTARDAVDTGDLSKLVHTNLVSVQLQPPGTVTSNGNGAASQPALPSAG